MARKGERARLVAGAAARVERAAVRVPRVLPELARVRDDHATTQGGAWTVQVGTAARGEAWTNHGARAMRVPAGDSPAERAVRLHEQFHALVSPAGNMAYSTWHAAAERLAFRCSQPVGVAVELMVALEEVRVNTLAARVFAPSDVREFGKVLRDGSEKSAGEAAARAAQGGSVDGFIRGLLFLTALANTAAANDFVRGARSVSPDVGAAFGAYRDLVRAQVRVWAANWRALASTHYVVVPYYVPVDVEFDGRVITEADFVLSQQRVDSDGEVIGAVPRGFSFVLDAAMELLPHFPQLPSADSNAPIRLADEAGTWQALVVAEPPLSVKARRSAVARRRQWSDSGKRLGSASRFVTDSRRRAFSTDRRESGAVVVVDLSGSMQWEYDDLQRFLSLVPAATVLGYSGGMRYGRKSTPHTAWVLARNGAAVSPAEFARIFADEVHGGNGCDGLALEWGAREAQRLRGRVPLVWITDGRVTDTTEHYTDEAAQDAGRRVREYGVLVYPTADVALAALARPAHARRLVHIADRGLRLAAEGVR